MTKTEKLKARKLMDWVANGDSYVMEIPPHTTTDKTTKDLASVMSRSKKHLSKRGNGVLIILTQYDDRTPLPSI